MNGVPSIPYPRAKCVSSYIPPNPLVFSENPGVKSYSYRERV